MVRTREERKSQKEGDENGKKKGEGEKDAR